MKTEKIINNCIEKDKKGKSKEMEEKKQRILGITHSGVFHNDEICCTAFLSLIFNNENCEFVWKRVSQVPPGINDDTENVIIYDIGGGKFDHHQENAPRRPDNTKYASFGLIFRQYGRKLLGDNFELFDKKFVQPVDLTDNYGQEKYPNPLSSYIASLNPLWDDDKETSDAQFEKAVEIVKEILKREFLSIRSKKNADDYVRELVSKCQESNSEVLIMPRFVHWQSVVVKESQVKFVIFPSPRNGYNLATVPMNLSSQTRIQRIPLPENWFNKTMSSDEIKNEYPGIIFWTRSFACFETIDEAYSTALRLIEEYNVNDIQSLENLVSSVEDW